MRRTCLETPSCATAASSTRSHRHRVAEEIYVVVSGSGRIQVDDDAFALQPVDAVRVAPGSAREFEAASAGLEVLAFGSHIPGDGEMVSERPTHE
jgi:mannose-6-phosphate isomerase-like protein (cupin superfamily)